MVATQKKSHPPKVKINIANFSRELHGLTKAGDAMTKMGEIRKFQNLGYTPKLSCYCFLPTQGKCSAKGNGGNI